MPERGPELTRPSDVRQAVGVRTGLVDELRKVFGPIAAATPLALAYLAPDGTEWLTTCDACPCSRQANGGMPCFTSGVKGRYTNGVDVTWDSKPAGQVLLCCDLAARPLETTVRHVVHNALYQLELERDKAYLLGELSASRESLEAVYDISSNFMRSFQNVEELLTRILDRAIGPHEGLRVILWLANEGQLVPAACKHVPPCEPRPLEGGLVGKTLAHRTSILLNGRSRLATIPDLESELHFAASVAVVPIASRQGLLGALEIWQEEDEIAFDSRMLYLLETLALLAAMVVENDRLHRETLQNERLRHDIEIGSRIQQVLLLGRPPVDLELIQAAAITLPSMQIDGDFYDFIEHEQTLDVIVGDVMGKGVPAALVGAATKTHFLRAMNYLLASQAGLQPEPKEILNIVNAELAKQLIGIESYVTLCYARFDLRNRLIHLIDCGHTRTIHYSNLTGQCEYLQGGNMPLGFAQGEVYETVTTPFAAGDVFLFYSDGVTEARNASGTQYGEDRLSDLVRSSSYLDPKDLVELIRQDVLAYSHAKTFQDDLTCVAVKIQDTEATIPSKRAKLDIQSDLDELNRVRTFVHEFCQRNFALRFVEDDLHQLELAVVEAVTNIIRHGYQGQKDRPIRLQCDLFLNRISVRLYHRGQPFDPGPEPVVQPESGSESGMGLYIIQQCVDKVRYYRSKHGENCIHLVKELKQDSSGGFRRGHHA